ncbi:NAD(+)/NADH kinase [Chloroflexota bacterium]
MLHFHYSFKIPGKKATNVKRIGILYHPMVEATQLKTKELQEFLEARGVSSWICSAWEREAALAQLNYTDLILTVGGDGTILRAAQAITPRAIPITGVNLGNLGFMTELNADNVMEKLPLLLAGEGWIDERTMLEAELLTKGKEPVTFHALNDVVAARGAIARVIYIEASINDKNFTTYKADGVVVATPTGSTGYALAAGGPILYPQSPDFLLIPVMPHLNPAFTVVLPPSAVVKLTITTIHEATLSIDGHINQPLESESILTVRHSPHTARFLRINPENSFFHSLEAKLIRKTADA